MNRRAALGILAGVLLAVPAHAAILGLPDRPAGFVTDQAGLLTDEQRASLESTLRSFNASTSIEIAVVTVPSLQGGDIDDSAVKLFEQWAIGQSETDQGVLFLVAKEDRAARIEVGYGLEGALTDAQAGQVLRQDVFPAFREERYGDGILAGVERIMRVTQGETLPVEEQEAADAGGWLPYVLFGAFFLFQALVAVMRSSKSWWLGGVLGGVAGLAVTALHLFGIGTVAGLILTGILALAGLVLDFVVSKFPIRPGGGHGGPWIGPMGGFGGGGGGGSGGFGGFGGGSSGGGGASGRW